MENKIWSLRTQKLLQDTESKGHSRIYVENLFFLQCILDYSSSFQATVLARFDLDFDPFVLFLLFIY